MSDDDFELLIPDHLRKWINPTVLAEVKKRIRQLEEAEAQNPIYYRRYLETHMEHIFEEAAKRARAEADEDVQARKRRERGGSMD